VLNEEEKRPLIINHEFWINCWKTNAIGFHETQPNTLLVAYFGTFAKKVTPHRVFVPMCGKSNDIQWLMNQGCHVIGCELSEIAIEALFESLQILPGITKIGQFKHYFGPNIDIFVGDLFGLTAEHVGKIDAIYDRAALVAWGSNDRLLYVDHLKLVTQSAPQLVITFECPPDVLISETQRNEGPPFFVQPSEMNALYSDKYQLNCLFHLTMSQKIRSINANQCIWECI
jgi:thiopurine S-methyltransferase